MAITSFTPPLGSTLTERAWDKMSIQVEEIHTTNLEPEHRGAEEMVGRLKTFERQSERRELELKRRVVAFINDLDRYADLCLARFIVWRDTRSKRRLPKWHDDNGRH
jgi:hypothetical protein